MAFMSASGAIMYFTFPLYIHDISGSYTAVGLSVSLPYLFFALGSYLWGRLSDRLRRRGSLIVVGIVGSSLLFPLYQHMPSVWAAIALRALQFSFLGIHALYPTMASEYMPDRKAWAISRVEMSAGLGATMGSVIGGITLMGWIPLGASGYNTTFMLCLLLSSISWVMLLFPPDSYRGRDPVLRSTPAGVLGNSALRPVILLSLITFLLFTGTNTILAVFPNYLSSLGLDMIWIGVFVALASATGIAAAHVTPDVIDKMGARKTYVIAIVAYVLVALGYSMVDNLWFILLLWMIPLWNFFTVSTATLAAQYSSEEQRGTAMGLLRGSLAAGTLIGATISGFLVDLIGFQRGFLLGAGIICISLAVALIWDGK